MLETFFQEKSVQNLTNPQSLQQFLSKLPMDNAFRALDEIMGALTPPPPENHPWDALFSSVSAIEEAAAPHLQHLITTFFHSPRLSPSEIRRLCNLNCDLWHLFLKHYVFCLSNARAERKEGREDKALLTQLVKQTLAAYGEILKWEYMREGALPADYWKNLGHTYLFAETAGITRTPPAAPDHLTVEQAYLKVLILQASSPDCLTAIELELAEHLIDQLLPEFTFSAESCAESVYWVDCETSTPPVRLARLPEVLAPSLRFFKPGMAQQRLKTWITQLKQTGDVAELPLQLDRAIHLKPVLLNVMHHLAAYWAPIPPQRVHVRHRVRHQVAVRPGQPDAPLMLSTHAAQDRDKASDYEYWTIENVGLGGFGARAPQIRGGWLKVGALLALQPEHADHWVLGLIKRYRPNRNEGAEVGIETLSRKLAQVSVRLAINAGERPPVRTQAVTALWLQDGIPEGRIRLLLPPRAFRPEDKLVLESKEHHLHLTALQIVRQGPDYELVDYRTQPEYERAQHHTR